MLVSAVAYWVLGNVLEYVRNVEKIIIVPIIAAFGCLKIIVSLYRNKYIGWSVRCNYRSRFRGISC